MFFTILTSLFYFLYGLKTIYLKEINEFYILNLLIFYIKVLLSYNKCTVSYIECKLRNVKKEEGVIFNIFKDYMSSQILFLLLNIYVFIYISAVVVNLKKND